MHDTCSEENDRLRLVCKKSDTVTEPAGVMADTDSPPPPPATLDVAELSLSASMQLPGDRLTLSATSLGDMYDMSYRGWYPILLSKSNPSGARHRSWNCGMTAIENPVRNGNTTTAVKALVRGCAAIVHHFEGGGGHVA